jgi:hypothetical protein
MKNLRYRDWYIQSRPAVNGDGFVAFASKHDLTDRNPLAMINRSIYFNFGDTEAEAIWNIEEEMDQRDTEALRWKALGCIVILVFLGTIWFFIIYSILANLGVI